MLSSLCSPSLPPSALSLSRSAGEEDDLRQPHCVLQGCQALLLQAPEEDRLRQLASTHAWAGPLAGAEASGGGGPGSGESGGREGAEPQPA
eukprot:3265158-Rhodomonas_salina.1